jgi:hypothetical protein
MGELLLRQPGEYSRGTQMTTVMETIDFGSGHVAQIAPPFSHDHGGSNATLAVALLVDQPAMPLSPEPPIGGLPNTCICIEIDILASPQIKTRSPSSA